MNDALRRYLTSRWRQRALGEFLARLDQEHGPLDTAQDDAEVERFVRLLGGAPE